MRRHIPVLALAPLVLAAGACTSDTDEPPGDTGDTGDTDREFHPLVPEEYKWLWNTEACERTNDQGQTARGDQLYVVLTEASSTADGTFTGTERWYWFFEERGWDDDCVDTMQVTGTPLLGDYGGYGCVECDEGWEIERTVTDATCEGVYYRYLLHEEELLSEVYQAAVMFDTLTPSGTPNEDHRMRVSHGQENQDGQLEWNHDWCWNNESCLVFWETDEYGPPATYQWIHDRCLTN